MISYIAKQFTCSLVPLAVIAISSAPTFAQSRLSETETASEINAANKLLRDGKVDEALEAFRHVVPDEEQHDELNYNMAVAEYRKGNIDAAEKLFGEVAGANAPTISSNSRYNLGNCQYAKAVQVAGQDKPAAIEHLRNAISHYRGALRGNSNNADARANIELAGALIRKLEQEQKQQEEQQDQQQEPKEQPEQKDESQQDSEQQKSDSKDSNSDQQKKDEQTDQNEASPSDKSKEDEQKKNAQENAKSGDESQKSDDQKSSGEESQSRQQKPSEEQAQPKGSDGKQTQPQSLQPQSGDQQQTTDDQQQPVEEGKPEEQEAKNQPVPGGDLKAVGDHDENKKPDDSGAMAVPNPKDGLMTREEALKMLQSVRDREMIRRMQQQRQARSRRVPVDRDW